MLRMFDRSIEEKVYILFDTFRTSTGTINQVPVCQFTCTLDDLLSPTFHMIFRGRLFSVTPVI